MRLKNNEQKTNKMPASFLFLSERKYKNTGIIILVILCVNFSFNTIFNLTIWPKWTDYPIIYVGVTVLTIVYLGAIIVNFYLLIPNLLLHNKYVPYLCSLFGLAIIIVSISMFAEFAVHSIYQLPMANLGNYENKKFLILYLFGNSIDNFFIFFTTSVFFFLQHWWKTGVRILELEEAGVRAELEKMRSKIDSNALFDVLNEAAAIVVSLPHEATRIIFELSKSLRQQLYESEQKNSFTTLKEKTKLTFSEQNHLLDFFIEKRYRKTRHFLFIFIIIIGSLAGMPSFNTYPFLVILAAVVLVNGVKLMMIYLNIYLLIPRLLFNNKMKTYLFSLCLIVFSIGIVYETPYLLIKKPLIDFVMICEIVANWTGTLFFIAVTTSIVVFQHWARNERYIAQLEAANMHAELEQLQNQINPHFLFNMLNNILVLIRENPKEAAIILRKMSDMMKYQFNDSTKKKVLLNDDIQFLTDFLNLEKIRRDRFEFSIDVEDNTGNILVPPLLFIPFVENAVKHSADAMNLSYIQLNFNTIEDNFHFSCRNSKPAKSRNKNEYSGLGLVNIRRRLELLYNRNHSLEIQEEETSYTVKLEIKYL